MVRAYEAIVFVVLVLHPEDFHVVLWGRLTQWEAKLICVTNYPRCRKQMWPLNGLELRFETPDGETNADFAIMRQDIR